jgi:hypothetical protein
MSITHTLWLEHPHRVVMTNINIVKNKIGYEGLAIRSVVFSQVETWSWVHDNVADGCWSRRFHHP